MKYYGRIEKYYGKITSHPKYPLFEQRRMNEAFSDSARTFFIIDKKETVGPMIQYFLTAK